MNLNNQRDSLPVPFIKPRVFNEHIKNDRLCSESVIFDKKSVPIYLGELTCKRMYSEPYRRYVFVETYKDKNNFCRINEFEANIG